MEPAAAPAGGGALQDKADEEGHAALEHELAVANAKEEAGSDSEKKEGAADAAKASELEDPAKGHTELEEAVAAELEQQVDASAVAATSADSGGAAHANAPMDVGTDGPEIAAENASQPQVVAEAAVVAAAVQSAGSAASAGGGTSILKQPRKAPEKPVGENTDKDKPAAKRPKRGGSSNTVAGTGAGK